MSKHLTSLLIIAGAVMLAGCVKYPSEKGQWSGRTIPLTLYTARGLPYEATQFVIDPDPGLHPFLVPAPALVEKHGKELVILSSKQFAGKQLIVKGVITGGSPLNEIGGQPLIRATKERRTNQWILTVLVVKDVEVVQEETESRQPKP